MESYAFSTKANLASSVSCRMSLNVTLPEPLESYVEAQIAQGTYASVNEYFQSLVRQDQERQGGAKLEAMLLEGDDSGDGSEVTAEFWRGLKAVS
jgi:antitoxin ParD1/3/4